MIIFYSAIDNYYSLPSLEDCYKYMKEKFSYNSVVLDHKANSLMFGWALRPLCLCVMELTLLPYLELPPWLTADSQTQPTSL